MSGDELTKLHELAEKLPPGPRKDLVDTAFNAVAHGIIQEEARKVAAERRLVRAEQREETKFSVGMALSIIGTIVAIGLVAAGKLKVTEGVAGAGALWILNYGQALITGKPGKSKKGEE